MKKYLIIKFCCCLFILHSSCFGQIVLDTTDLPLINVVQVTSIVDSSMAISLSPGNSGANVTWDFTNLVYCCVDFKNYRWTNPQYSVNAAFFPEAEIALKTQCYLYHDWSTHVVTEICDYRDYFIKDSTGLNYYGSDFPNPHKSNVYRNIFPLLAYGQSKTNNFRIVNQLSVDSLYISNIVDTMIADGWGTINTQFGTYNVLRIYTKESVRDSLYINGIGQLVKLMPLNYYYKWYTKGLGFPVLQISKGILETSPDYQIARVARYKWYETSIAEVSKSDFGFTVYPNPLTTESVISLDIAKTSRVCFTLLDVIGQKIDSFTDNFRSGNHKLSLAQFMKKELPKGVYYLSLSVDNEQKTIKLIK